MLLIRSTVRWLDARWRTAGTATRGLIVVSAILLSPLLFVGLLIALAFELVSAIDRDRRLTPAAHWALATFAVLSVLFVVSASRGGAAGRGDGEIAIASPSPAATATATATVAPSPTPVATPSATATPTLTVTPLLLGAAPVGATERATVLRVVDGDTIEVDRGHGPEKVRYIGVDTPEVVAPDSPVEWMGVEASAANEALVGGREVVLESDVSETDQYGRLLRYVWLQDASWPTGWLLVNLALVEQGFAQVTTYPPDVRYVDLYLAAQVNARETALGLWGAEPSPSPTPMSTPTPAPTATPVAVTYDDAVVIDDKVTFRGSAGTYSWETVSIVPYAILARWDATSTSSAGCRTAFRLEDRTGLEEAVTGTIKIEGSTRKTGSRLIDTRISSARFVVESSCPKWLISMVDNETRGSSGGGGGSGGNCDPSYPGVCIPPYPPDLDCDEVPYDDFEVLQPDPHGFDGDEDGIGCES